MDTNIERKIGAELLDLQRSADTVAAGIASLTRRLEEAASTAPPPRYAPVSHPVDQWTATPAQAADPVDAPGSFPTDDAPGYRVDRPPTLEAGDPACAAADVAAAGFSATSTMPNAAPPQTVAGPPLPAFPRADAAGADDDTAEVAEEPIESWSDTAGSKILGWVGAGITVLGIVLLLVIASQHGLIGPVTRVLLGAIVGMGLLAGGLALHGRAHRQALATTVVCSGLAVEYLVTVAAVRSAELIPALVGHGLSALIVALSIAFAISWRQQWIAGASFLTSGLLAMAVGSGTTNDVLVFEAILVAGGTVALWQRVGLYAWAGAAVAATLTDIAATGSTMHLAHLWIILATALISWIVFLARWLTGRAPSDPGEFPIRPRSTDPDQIARDYADFDAHESRRERARTDLAVATASLAVAAALMALALATVTSFGPFARGAGLTAAVFTVGFAAVAFAATRHAALANGPTRIIAWLATLVLAAISLLRLFHGDARSIAWLVLAVVAVLIVAHERLMKLVAPVVIFSGIATLAAAPALNPADLLDWPPAHLFDPAAGLETRAWATVLPAGACLVVLCAAVWWAIWRAVTEAENRSTTMAWTTLWCSAVACYGVLAMLTVLAYAISPTHAAYETAQILVTALLTVVGLALIWTGFRSLTLRLGGLGLTALAVAKLLLLDTGSLDAVPRAMTVIGVGILLLVGAAVFLRVMPSGSQAASQPASETDMNERQPIS